MNLPDKENVSFESLFKRLEDILYKLENELDNTSLDEIIKYYEEGLILLKICRKKLSEAELRIEKISAEQND